MNELLSRRGQLETLGVTERPDADLHRHGRYM